MCSKKVFLSRGLRVLLYLTLFQLKATAGTEKLALIIGNNRGLADEPVLRYAANDARGIYETLTKLAGVNPKRCYLLTDAIKKDILTKLNELSGRVKELNMQGKKTQFLIYYSGHGSLEAIHIKGEKISLAEIKRQFKSIEADLKILISDACFSGAIHNNKGGKKVEPMENIKMYDTLEVSGSVILTSSTEGEISQESKDLKASYFTYYFNSGLKGPADNNKDGFVSFMEAYNYTSRNIKQHGMTPTFDIQMRGTEDLVLTNIKTGKCKLVFKDVPYGKYRVINDVNQKNAADVIVDDTNVVLALPPNKYVVRRDGMRKYFLAKKELAWSGNHVVRAKDFRSYSYDVVNPKGSPMPNHIQMQAAFLSRLAEIKGPIISPGFMYQRSYGRISLIPTFGFLIPKRVRGNNLTITYSGINAGGELRYSIFPRLKGTAYLGLKGLYWRLNQQVAPEKGGYQAVRSTAEILNTYAIAGCKFNIPKMPFIFSLVGGIGPHWHYDNGDNLKAVNGIFLTPSLGLRF